MRPIILIKKEEKKQKREGITLRKNITGPWPPSMICRGGKHNAYRCCRRTGERGRPTLISPYTGKRKKKNEKENISIPVSRSEKEITYLK